MEKNSVFVGGVPTTDHAGVVENRSRVAEGRCPLHVCPKCGLMRVKLSSHMDTLPCRARQNRFAMERAKMTQTWYDPSPAKKAGVRVEHLGTHYMDGCKYWGAKLLIRYWAPVWLPPIWKDQQQRYVRYEKRETEFKELVRDPGKIVPLLTHIAMGDGMGAEMAAEVLKARDEWLPFLKEHFSA